MEDKKVDPVKAEAVRLVAQSNHVISIVKGIVEYIQQSGVAAAYKVNGLKISPVISPDLENVESSSFTRISITSSMSSSEYSYPDLQKYLSRMVIVNELQDEGEFIVNFGTEAVPNEYKKTYKINDPDVLKAASRDIFAHLLKG